MIGQQFDSISSCEIGGIFEVQKLYGALKSLAEGDKQSALVDLANFASYIPKELEKCQTLIRDEELLINFKAKIQDKKTFLFHILESMIVNTADMEEKLNSAVLSYKADDLYNCGISLGSLMSEGILGS